jgi:uncharacterized protein (TIGR02466 family)
MKTDKDGIRFWAPFGPKFLHVQLLDDVKLKLLNCVNQLRQSDDKSNREIIHNYGEENEGSTQASTIVDGEIGYIDRKDQEKYGNIVADTVTGLIETYVRKFYEVQEDDTEIHQSTENFEYLPTDCWYVVMKSGDFHLAHTHHRMDDLFSVGQISGAIYLDIPENLPYPQGNIQWIESGRKEKLSGYMQEYSPISGHALVWPSWLVHSVHPFRGNEERIMISFNGVWRQQGNTNLDGAGNVVLDGNIVQDKD